MAYLKLLLFDKTFSDGKKFRADSIRRIQPLLLILFRPKTLLTWAKVVILSDSNNKFYRLPGVSVFGAVLHSC